MALEPVLCLWTRPGELDWFLTVPHEEDQRQGVSGAAPVSMGGQERARGVGLEKGKLGGVGGGSSDSPRSSLCKGFSVKPKDPQNEDGGGEGVLQGQILA